jgi:hypothetical protein
LDRLRKPIFVFHGVFRRYHVANNPINFVDPNGKLVPFVLIGAGGTLGGLIGGGVYALITDNFTWGGLAGAVAAGAIAGGVGAVAPTIAGSLGLGGFAGTALVNATAGLAAASVSAAFDPCQHFTLGYAASSAAFGALGGAVGAQLFPTHGMSNFAQVGFPRSLSGVIPEFFGGTAGPNAMNAIYTGGTISFGIGAVGPVFFK